MAGVTIDLGIGRRVTLYNAIDAPLAARQAAGQRDAAEFLRRWPISKADAFMAFQHAQQLRLHAFPSFGLARGDWVAALKMAVERGQVLVVMDAARSAGGGPATQPAMRRDMAAGPSWPSFASMAPDGGASMYTPLGSATAFTPLSAVGAVSSATADDLMSYLQSVVGGGGDAVGDDSDASTLLGDAQPFDLGDSPVGDIQQDAGVLLTPSEEAECEMQLAADKDECSAWYIAKPSSYSMCMDRAMQRYANCLRGVG